MKGGSTAAGLRAVLISTAVAGVIGYLIQLAAPAMLPSGSAYVSFSVFWSTLYLGVAALAGIQQEVSRATHRTEISPPVASPLRRFAALAAVVVTIGAIAFALLLGNFLVPQSAPWMAVALPIGLGGYVLSASLGGVLYGLKIWAAVAFTTIADAAIRAVLLLPGFSAQLSVPWLALFVVLPFGIAFALTWLVFRKQVVGKFRLDVGLRRLSSHASSTVAAAAASGLMISGLPMLIGATSSRADLSMTGALILTITLTRAPIVIPVIALQSFLIAAVFKNASLSRSAMVRVVAAGAAGIGILAAASWLIGPLVVSFVSNGRFAIHGWQVAVIVVSAGLTAAMCTTGPALVARRRHIANLIGWGIAALLTVIALIMPWLQEVRVSVALIVPVAVGLTVHSLALSAKTRANPAQ